QPAGERDLLLVAAGKIGDQLLWARHADVELLAEFLDHGTLGGFVDEHAPALDPLVSGHTEIDAHRERQEQRLLLAVLRYQADPVADGVLRRTDMDLAAVDDDATGIERVRAEDRPRHLGAAGADQPGDAEDLAPAHFETDIG